MNEIVKMYKLRLLVFGITIPILTIFFEILGISLWVSLSDKGGWKYGLPIIVFGVCLGMLYLFCYKHMKNKLIKLQNENNTNRKGESQ
jgi:Na+/melibiose symporter-like transporter